MEKDGIKKEDLRQGILKYLQSNMGGIAAELCEGSQLLEVRRDNDLCYVGADGITERNGAVVLLGGGSMLKNDVERCLESSKKYWVCP